MNVNQGYRGHLVGTLQQKAGHSLKGIAVTLLELSSKKQVIAYSANTGEFICRELR